MKKTIIRILFIVIVLSQPSISATPFKRLNINTFQSIQLWKLSQLYGCARYFAPNSHIDNLDWYGFIENNVRDLLLTTSESQADSLLLNRFSVLIPNLRFVDKVNIQNQVAVAPFYIKATTLNTGFQKSPTTSRLIKIEYNQLQIPQYYHIQLSPGLFAVYSIITDSVQNETNALLQLKKDSKYKWEKHFYISPYYRLANAIITGAYIQHFYAYFEEDRLSENWEDEMKKYFCQVALCSSYPEYLNASYKHYAHVNDGHLFVMNGYSKPEAVFGKYQPIYYPQIVLGAAEDECIYVKNCPPNCEIKKGDKILAINGRKVKELIDEKKLYVSAATEAARIGKVLDMFLFQSFKKDSVISLKVQRKDLEQLDYSIYINKGDNHLSENEAFISSVKENSIWGVHPSTEPYQRNWEYEKPVSIKINTPVYFLTNRNAISFGETVLELIKNHRIGIIIGESTSGTNGDAIILKSPSMGYIFTGYKFLNHNGSLHHGIGVIPDVECQQKLSDIQNGEDTFVKKACELILKNEQPIPASTGQ